MDALSNKKGSRESQSDLVARVDSRKVSEVFLEYVEPLLEALKLERPDATYQDYEQEIRVPWMVWNILCSDHKDTSDRTQMLSQLRKIHGTLPTGTAALIEKLIARKQSHFSNYKYMIGAYSIRYAENGDVLLWAEARTNNSKLH